MIEDFEDKSPVVPESAWVHEAAWVGGDVTLGEDVSVWPMATIRGDVQSVTIGARSNVQEGCVIHVTHKHSFSPGYATIIGEDVTIGHKAIIHACEVRDRCLIGMGAIVLDGAVIEEEVIVGAGSVVSPGKVLEAGHLYLGAPARKVRELSLEEKAHLVESSEGYAALKERHRNG